MTAYYNEFDSNAAAWLRELIKQDHIAPGVVDERSIEDIEPAELEEFTQCHFFAGIGVWSYALRRAGWPDDRPVWTGSCPCQPFSSAGKTGGFADERHLWPAWFHLIQHAKRGYIPVFGEQVASKDGLAWLDLVQTDMEAAGYTCGTVDICAAGFGAPHIRQRQFFVAERVADSGDRRLQGSGTSETARYGNSARATGGDGRLVDPVSNRLRQSAPGQIETRPASGRVEEVPGADKFGELPAGFEGSDAKCTGLLTREQPGPTNGFWRDSDWLGCRDGKFRPVEPGTFPLVDRPPARVGRLRGYGNAINAEVAAAFIEAYLGLNDVMADQWGKL